MNLPPNFTELQAIALVPNTFQVPLNQFHFYRASQVLAFMRVFGATSNDPNAIVAYINELIQEQGFDMGNTLLIEALLTGYCQPLSPNQRSYFGVNLKAPFQGDAVPGVLGEIWDGDEFLEYEVPQTPLPLNTPIIDPKDWEF